MSYQELLHHSILELDELNSLIISAQKIKSTEEECPYCKKNSKCISCRDRDKIVLHHMLLVRKISGEFSRRCHLPADDFMADGIIGLNLAIDEFDLSESNKFFHFAENRIRWQIVSGDLFGPLVNIPKSARKSIKDITERIDRCRAKGIPISYKKICRELKITEKRFHELLEVIKSWQRSYFIELEEGDVPIYDHNFKNYHFDNEEWIYEEDLKPALEFLNEYQRYLITSYYGIGTEEKTLRELSQEYDQSYEKTRLDYHNTIERLRTYFKKEIEGIKNE